MIQPIRPTWLEIDLDAIGCNVRALRAKVSAHLMAVVKADAYGHGALPVATRALQEGAVALGVAIPEEGVLLREAGISAPILVLGGIDEAGARAAAQHGLTQTVFDTATVRRLAQAAYAFGTQVRVHLKIDSGMGRVGVRDVASLRAVAQAVLDEPTLLLVGVFTHFSTADAEDLAYTDAQAARFMPLVAELRKLKPDLLVHAANSAALLRCPAYHFDLVRAGIALYVNPQLPGGPTPGLSDAMRWVTHAVHCKEIDTGESVSYGRIFRADRTTRVLTLPVGYADGYHRAIGGRGYALVRGKRAPVIGRVCMDQAMIDVTEIDGATVGDEVVLLGKQGNAHISAQEMGAWCGMIDYEIVLSPSQRVPRIYK